MYSHAEVLDEIKRKAERAGCSVVELLERAGVAHTQWVRWNKPAGDPDRTSPTLGTLERIFKVPDLRRRRRGRARA